MNAEPESVTRKFRSLRDRAGLSMDELAKAMGYARASSIQRYENPDEYTKQFISPELVMKMITALVGKGEPPITAAEVWSLARPEVIGARPIVDSFDPDASSSDEDSDSAAYSREHWKPGVEGAIPEVDMKLGAGSGVVGETINLPVGPESVSGHSVVAEWLIPLAYLRNEAKASPAHTLVMEVTGDSMLPTYMPGDRVLVDLSQNDMTTDTVYAISDGYTEPQIKRLQRIPFSDPPQVRIISDNSNLETFTVDLNRLTIIGRICGHIARK
ncbi:MAG TPA: LexA family transcriptional regulator [Pseudorhizobium sp.]|jgi:transcriptional regulator with XRE-family HTH domain|nr:LexA family transcriptional regulator [Pseudorhizobium sp.]